MKKCPFCRGDAEVRFTWKESGSNNAFVYVECIKCGVKTRKLDYEPDNCNCHSVKEIIGIWDTRDS